MKKRLLPITLLCLVGLIGAGCGGSKKKKDPTPTPTPTQHTETPTPTPTPTPTDVAVTGVELNKEQLELAVGGKEQLLATVLPENATNKAVTWKSSDPDVASVKDGLVTANEVGSANITVTTADGGFSKTCAVSVKILMESITITNKEEFAEFSVGQNRALVLESSPEVNFAELMSKGLIELTSSDPEIVNFSGLQVYALKKGQTTITVSVFGVSDTLELDVLGEKTAKELYGTVHEGTLEDPLDNADAVKIGKWAEEQGGSTSTPETFYIKGIVDSFYNAPGSRTDGMVAFYLKKGAEDTDRFEVYKTFFEDGTPLTDDDIWIGAEVLASGHITFYKSSGNVTYETTGAVFHGVTGGDPKPAPRETIQSTLAEVLSIGAQLDDGADSYDYYVFDAYVTVKSGDNYFLTAAKGEALDEQTSDAAHSSRKYYANAFEIYGAKAEGLAEKLMKNAKVTVKAILKNYHGQVENLIALTADDVTVLEQGELWVIPEHDVTVAQAIEETGKLADGQTSVDFYNLKEVYVTEVTSAYSAQYGNMSFKVADAADAEQQLLVYRAKTDAETAAKVIVGAQVTIKGNLQKYVKGEEVTPELVNVGSITVKTGGELPPEYIEKSFAEVMEIGAALTAETTEKYRFQAYVVVRQASGQYYNFFLGATADAATDNLKALFEIYKLPKDQYDLMTKGALIQVTCTLKNYNGQVENGNTLEVEVITAGGDWDAPQVINSTFAEVMTIGAALTAETADQYKFQAYVVYRQASGQYYNFFLGATADAATEDLKALFEVYKLPQTQYELMTKGALIEVTCTLKNYNGQVENGNSLAVSVVTAGEPWDAPVPTPTPVEGESVKFVANAQGYENAQEVASWTSGDVTITFDKGTNNNAPKYYNTGEAIRVYGGGFFTVASSAAPVVQVVLTFGSGDSSNEITVDKGQYTAPTWTGEEESVKFTVGGTSGQRRIASIEVFLLQAEE